jgi:hypothetical protein
MQKNCSENLMEAGDGFGGKKVFWRAGFSQNPSCLKQK